MNLLQALEKFEGKDYTPELKSEIEKTITETLGKDHKVEITKIIVHPDGSFSGTLEADFFPKGIK